MLAAAAYLALFLTPAVFLGAASAQTRPVEPPDQQAIVKSNTAFALDLYAQLGKTDGNLFICPFSVSSALTMTWAGARGETASQMASVLHLALEPERVHAAYEALLAWPECTAGQDGPRLNIANALWAQRNYPFLPGFVAICRRHYRAGIENLDFVAALEDARQTINRWVAERTAEKIQELIAQGVLDPTTRLVLTNATYFKGRWATRFDPQKTRPGSFTRADKSQVTVPFMEQTGTFGYLDLPGCQILELPYAGEALSMLIVLPASPDGLASIERDLTPGYLSEWFSRLEPRQVQVAIPKFTLTSQFRLDQALRSLGMTHAFDPAKADFSGMDGTRNLYIGAVLHQAFVEVNEEGTEAAGATAVVMKIRAGPREEIPVFRANRPFLFLIRDNRTGSILFMGRLADPPTT